MRIVDGIYIYKAEGVEIRTPFRYSLEERKKFIKSVRTLKKMGLVFVLVRTKEHGKIVIDTVNKVIFVEIE